MSVWILVLGYNDTWIMSQHTGTPQMATLLPLNCYKDRRRRRLRFSVFCLDYTHKQTRKICSNFCAKFATGKELLERWVCFSIISTICKSCFFFPLRIIHPLDLDCEYLSVRIHLQISLWLLSLKCEHCVRAYLIPFWLFLNYKSHKCSVWKLVWTFIFAF